MLNLTIFLIDVMTLEIFLDTKMGEEEANSISRAFFHVFGEARLFSDSSDFFRLSELMGDELLQEFLSTKFRLPVSVSGKDFLSGIVKCGDKKKKRKIKKRGGGNEMCIA